MNITMKQISMMVFGSVAWLVCAVALPMQQGTDGLSAKVANLVIAPAFASSGDDEAKSDDDESKDKDEGKDDESKDKSGDTSSSYDFSSATLVCVSQSSVLTALNFTSSEDEAKSDDDESKDDEAKSDDDGSSDDEAKSDDDGSSDDEAKSDDDESKDDEAKSDDDESKDEDSTELSASFIQSLPACTVFGASAAGGVWIPSSAIVGTTGGTTTTTGGTTTTTGGSVTLDSSVTSAYFSELAAGGSGLTGTPSSTLESYREIRGE